MRGAMATAPSTIVLAMCAVCERADADSCDDASGAAHHEKAIRALAGILETISAGQLDLSTHATADATAAAVDALSSANSGARAYGQRILRVLASSARAPYAQRLEHNIHVGRCHDAIPAEDKGGSACARARAIVSVVPPAGAPTKMRTGAGVD